MRQGGDKRLVLVVQVDDYLNAEFLELASRFEQPLQNQFHIDLTEAKSFRMTGARLV